MMEVNELTAEEHDDSVDENEVEENEDKDFDEEVGSVFAFLLYRSY